MLIRSDARHIPLKDESVQCVVTSPPYWGLRKYSGAQEQVWGRLLDCDHDWSVKEIASRHGDNGVDGSTLEGGKATQANSQRYRVLTGVCQLCGAWRGSYGLEPTIDAYVEHTVEIFREVRRVLRKDGVCFLNIGDTYFSQPGNGRGGGEKLEGGLPHYSASQRAPQSGLKPKDLCLIPFRVALALQADGWWVRSDIIWNKPNPMPESVRDRPTDAYEHIFMLTRSAKYYWDTEAVKEPATTGWRGAKFTDSRENAIYSNVGQGPRDSDSQTRNLRNVWTFPTQPYKGAHFATFPEELVTRCVKAATKPLDLVLDPFAGSGTVGKVALKMGRRFALCDLAYQDLQRVRVGAPIIT